MRLGETMMLLRATVLCLSTSTLVACTGSPGHGPSPDGRAGTTIAGRSTEPSPEPDPPPQPDDVTPRADDGVAPVGAEAEQDARPSALVLDFDHNMLMGDVDGAVLERLSTRREALHACLRGLEERIEAGEIAGTSVDFALDADGVKELGFRRGADDVNACLESAVEDLSFSRAGVRGVIDLRPREPGLGPRSSSELKWTEAFDAMRVEMHARLRGTGSRREVTLEGHAVVGEGVERGFPDRNPLEIIDEYTHEDGSLTATASWSHNETELPRCLEGGGEIALESPFRAIERGRYVGAEIWLITGPCEGPVETHSLGVLWIDWIEGEEPTMRLLPLWRSKTEESPAERMQRRRRQQAFGRAGSE